MGRFVRRFLPAIVFLLSVASCSVKEDRSGCPCRLSLDLGEIKSGEVDSVSVVLASVDGFFCRETIGSELFGQNHVLLLPKSSHMVFSAISGAGDLWGDDGAIIIPLGKDCPAVYMDRDILNTDCEVLEKVVLLKKNFCRLKIIVKDEKYFDFQLVIRGNVNGYNPDGSPSEGDFRYVSPLVDGGYEASLPRQLDASLVLDIEDNTDVLKTFALGEYLLASGYDWTVADLPDVTIGIDYARTNLTVSVQGWDKVYEFDFVI